MQLKETKEALNRFAKYVIQQARTNLTKGDKATGDRKLYNSLYKDIKVSRDSIDVIFGGEDYMGFVDLGVKGKDPKKVSPNAKITGQQAPYSPYRFGSGTRRGTFKEFTKRMSAFAKAKNIRFRQGKTGKFAKGGYDAMGYVIASNIYNRGIKPSMFFTKPFQRAFKYLPQELKDAFIFDIEQDKMFFPENMNKN